MPHVTASSWLVIRGYPLPPALALPKRHFPAAMPPTVRVFDDNTSYQLYRALSRLSQALSSRVSPPLPSPSAPPRPRPPTSRLSRTAVPTLAQTAAHPVAHLLRSLQALFPALPASLRCPTSPAVSRLPSTPSCTRAPPSWPHTRTSS
jgi:hypothetical protein